MEPNFSNNIKYMVNAFYSYCAEVFVDYKSKGPHYSIKTVKDETNPNGEEIEIKKEQSFDEYLMFQLYYNFGVKRRMINDNIALFYYDKHLPGYKADSPVTMLCRHMMFDFYSMRIISLGIPKAMKLDKFCDLYGIDMNTRYNIEFENGSHQIIQNPISKKYNFYEFPEGTMITYNPSLAQYNIQAVTPSTPEGGDDAAMADIETDANVESVKANISAEFNKAFMFSTRRVLGTGTFGSQKTFLQMFEENNQNAGLDLSLIPAELIKDTVLVFNIEHPDNNIIGKKPINRNTLCGVFKFKSQEESVDQFLTILNKEEIISDEIKQLFGVLANGMVTQIPVEEFVVACGGLNIQTPMIIENINSVSDESIIVTVLHRTSIDNLKSIISHQPIDFQGLMIYGANGERTKIINEKYKSLLELKGHKPITIEEWNLKNLFFIYWRLMKTNKIADFLAAFELADSDRNYKKLFQWFSFMINGFSMGLFKAYHYSFVKKLMPKTNIPYAMKPMCGDLHTQYLKDKVPVSKNMVDAYLTGLSGSKIFWRLFSQQ